MAECRIKGGKNLSLAEPNAPLQEHLYFAWIEG